MTRQSDQTRIAEMCKALGDPTRLRIFQFLRSCCCPVAVEENGDLRRAEGATAGEVCCSVTGVARINSTISFHLKELRLAGLITVERQGRSMVCTVDRQALALLAAYFAQAADEMGAIREESAA